MADNWSHPYVRLAALLVIARNGGRQAIEPLMAELTDLDDALMVIRALLLIGRAGLTEEALQRRDEALLLELARHPYVSLAALLDDEEAERLLADAVNETDETHPED